MLKKILLITFITISITSFSQLYPNNTFTASKTEVCVGEEITFTSTSTKGPSGLDIVEEKLSVGQGVQAIIKNGANNTFTHSYTSSGTQIVQFVATNSNGTNTVAAEITITINPLPNVSFNTSPSSCTLPVPLSITNNSSNGNYTYSWDFGNGQTSTSNTPSNIEYDSEGTFPISLEVTNTSTSCSASLTKTVEINEFIADFTLSKNEICVNEQLNLTDNSVGATSWSWSNGNNINYSNQNPILSYNTDGTYDITLTATNNNNGCVSQVSKTLTVNPLPIINISASPSSGCAELDVTFTNNSTNGTSYEWNFGDGTPNFSGTTPPIHKYLSNGTYTVTIDASNDFGCVSNGIASVIQVSPIVPDFTSNIIDGCSPINVQFSDLSSVPNPSDDPIVSWNWDFGNGNTSSSQSPSVETFTTGKYEISLTITTQNGCTDNKVVTEYIKVGEIDSIGFSNTPDTICANTGTVNFTDLSSIVVPHDPSEIIYDWNFGDSEPGRSSVKNPTYNYPQDTGSFDVSLTVTFRGCIDSFRIDSAVFAWSPISKFTADSDDKCSPSSFPVQFDITDSSKIGRLGDNVEMVYKWGDPLNSTTNFSSSDYDTITDKWSSNFNYTNYGTYTIRQVIRNNTTGCIDSSDQQITISKVAADFTFNPETICLGSSLSLNDLSTSIMGDIIDVSYEMASEGLISGNVNGENNYTFINSGNKDITLTALDVNGCSGDTTLQVTVYSLPIAEILLDDQTPCAPQNVIYINNSDFETLPPHATSIASSSWILPDGSIVNNINENIPYTISDLGSYSATLQVTDDFGCISEDTTLTITVSKPTANFTRPDVKCNNTVFDIINNSVDDVSNEWTLDNILISGDDDLTYTIKEPIDSPISIDHKLTLISTDINGCQDSITETLTISIPKADLSTPILSGDNQNTANQFSCPPVDMNSSNNSTTPNISTWTFGNGNTAFSSSSTYAFYDKPGYYTLRLDIVDQYGCTDDTVLVDFLFIGGPKATPIVTPPLDICKNNFIFTIIDTSDVFSLTWDFGDNTNSILDSIEHGYPLAGTYSPSLTVYDKDNCAVNYETDAITVLNELSAKHSTTPSQGITNENVTFIDESIFKGEIVSWYWEFGDFNNTNYEVDNNNNQIFKYKYPFTYESVLTVTDEYGCVSSDTLLVKITGDFETVNVFTPNNDGINDVFEFDVDIFESYDVLVLNRWGNIVYDKKGVTGTYIWNGTHNDGNECTDGVYFFKVVGAIKDGTPFEASGYVTKIKG